MVSSLSIDLLILPNELRPLDRERETRGWPAFHSDDREFVHTLPSNRYLSTHFEIASQQLGAIRSDDLLGPLSSNL
jgi:hypothetical protein